VFLFDNGVFIVIQASEKQALLIYVFVFNSSCSGDYFFNIFHSHRVQPVESYTFSCSYCFWDLLFFYF